MKLRIWLKSVVIALVDNSGSGKLDTGNSDNSQTFAQLIVMVLVGNFCHAGGFGVSLLVRVGGYIFVLSRLCDCFPIWAGQSDSDPVCLKKCL